ncbi:hypothetical protein ANACOL_00804 [Anaerotruncus colihominis DSM 17241]|uniref:Uncharacterized protein n=1 Tax=Anaerotruncus colihominis DSM 17241 TaxID=445972 RepID=B0P7R6_9FIRM|nr:hypothetical protein ANACOL_00804 [Anaerotruncus colihominis DSM 17241]
MIIFFCPSIQLPNLWPQRPFCCGSFYGLNVGTTQKKCEQIVWKNETVYVMEMCWLG